MAKRVIFLVIFFAFQALKGLYGPFLIIAITC